MREALSSGRAFPELSLGVSAGRYFGEIDSKTDVTFPDRADLNPSNYSASDQYSGFGGRIGVTLQPSDAFRFSGVMETGVKLNRVENLVSSYTDLGRTIIDTTGTNSGSLTIPPRYTIGASYTSGRFLLSAEGNLQPWNTTQFSTARNSTRLAIGLERLPGSSLNATGFDEWTFRFGGFYEQTYFALPGGGINQMGGTLGLGIPITTYTGLNDYTGLDIGATFGVRGSTDNGLTRELFAKLSVELSVGEAWFVRSRR